MPAFQKVDGPVRLDREIRTVILSGDPGCDGYNAEAVLVLEHILSAKADFHMVLGDLVPTGQERWFRQFHDIANRAASVPVYALPGNHDLPDYEAHCGRRDYFIAAPNALWIVLDNARRYFTDATVTFLAETLRAEQCPHVFIAFHIPPPNPFVPNHVAKEEWDKIRAVLEPHAARVEMIFCGHVHSAFDYRLDGFRVIVTGGGGARLDEVDSGRLANDGHHAFRLDYADGIWALSIMGAGHDIASITRPYAKGAIKDELYEGFSGEAQAYRRYQISAELAALENFPNVARLFRAAAESEFHHSRNMFLASGGSITTQSLLEHSVARERDESERRYPAAAAVAEGAPSRSPVTAFACALHAEKIHMKLFDEALAHVRAGEDMPPQKFFTCLRCGYTHAGMHPPTLCPACGTDRFKFREVE